MASGSVAVISPASVFLDRAGTAESKVVLFVELRAMSDTGLYVVLLQMPEYYSQVLFLVMLGLTKDPPRQLGDDLLGRAGMAKLLSW